MTIDDLIRTFGSGASYWQPQRRLSGNDPGGGYPIGPKEAPRRPDQSQTPGAPAKDPSIGNVPGLGGYIREQNPDVALEDWLNRMYLSPQLKALLRQALPQLQRQSLLQQSQLLDTGVGLGGIPTNPFQAYLAGLNPFMVMQQLLRGNAQAGGYQARYGGQQGGSRQRLF